MKRIAFVALMALFTMNLWAQQTQGAGKPRFDPQEFQQRMEEALTRQAGLTADEAKAFFPIFLWVNRLRTNTINAVMNANKISVTNPTPRPY